jgi:hypothetical protein
VLQLLPKVSGNMQDTQDRSAADTKASIWDRITAFSTVALALIALFALVFTYLQIRDYRSQSQVQINEMRAESKAQHDEMREESKVQHLMEVVGRFNSPEQLVIRRNLALKRVDRKRNGLYKLDPDSPPVEMEEELDLCNNIGLLTERGYLDLHDVWSEFSEWAFYLYRDSHSYLDGLVSPADYKECKDLVENMRPIEKAEGKNMYSDPDEDQLYDSYVDDIDRAPGLPTPVRRRVPPKQ